jgi:lipoprotein
MKNKKYLILLITLLLSSCNKQKEEVPNLGVPNQQIDKNSDEENFDSSLINDEKDIQKKEEGKKSPQKENPKKDTVKKAKEDNDIPASQGGEIKTAKPDGIVEDYKEEKREVEGTDGEKLKPESVVKIESYKVNEALLQDWYNNHIATRDASINIIEYTDKPGYGVYGNLENIFENVELKKHPSGNYMHSTKNEDGVMTVYVINEGKVELIQ